MAEPSTALVLRSARVHGRDAPVDLTIVDGRITAATDPIGSGLIPATVPDAAVEIVDLEGRLVVPGLWDEHVHFTQWALTSGRLDVSSASSAREAAEMVARRAGESVATSGPIVGFGFRDGLWTDAPSIRLLDDAAPGTGVVLMSGDLHCVWLNTAAAQELGVGVDEAGLLREDAAFAVQRALDDLPAEVVDRWAAGAAERAAARGVVGVHDFEMTWNRDTWVRRRASGFDALRVGFAVYPGDVERAAEEGLRTGERLDDLLEVGYLKVLIDGSLNTRTAYCHDPYPAKSGDAYGVLTVAPGELEEMLRRGTGAGLVPAVHAIGDRAIGVALDVFERLAVGGRIEHAQLVAAMDLPRFASLGVIASVQPAHLLDDRDVAEHHWGGRTGRAYPLRSLLDAGARLAFGSDAPVAALDPWVAMAAAVHRGGDEGTPWHPEQSLSVSEALAASTRGRTVALGGVADLAILDDDPWQASEKRLRTMPVAGTVLNGRFTHRAL